MKSPMFSTVTLPPYCTRTERATPSPKASARTPRTDSAIVRLASTGVAARPVPIAHSGS